MDHCRAKRRGARRGARRGVAPSDARIPWARARWPDVGGQQLQHLGVGAPAAPGEGVGDQVGEVEVPDDHGVGVTEGQQGGRGRRPGTDPGDLLERPASGDRRTGRRGPRTGRPGGRPAGSPRPGAARRPGGGSRRSPARPAARAWAGGGGGPAPGAAAPCFQQSARKASQASRPVTFCSRMVGTRTSTRFPVAGRRRPGLRRTTSATAAWWATKASGRSPAPTMPGTRARAVSAPGPQASATTSVTGPGWSVASAAWPGPAAVWVARQKPSPARRVVGSWALRRMARRVRRRSTGGTAEGLPERGRSSRQP